jgi:putative peptide zinc metalloprotease protein
MNLTRALEVALPQIPARQLAERYPRMDPGASSREHVEDGKRVVRIYVPCAGGMYSFAPEHWQLAQLFDGRRSYEEIATLYSQERNIEYSAEQVRDFADELETGQFWYKTPQEKNILLMQQTTEERRKKLKVRSRWADLSEVTFPAFNPDRFLTWFYGKTKFVYTPWFTVLTLIGFGISAGITITHWSQVWSDTLDFYNFSNKTWGDVISLYTLGMFVVAVHEFAHAHTCKHYGARVPAMGFALVYLTPAFYTDTTEGTVMGSRYQRFIISMSGIWSELILYSIAAPIWLDTPPETLVHDSAHFIMMMTGLMSLLINWNPLMKLDGYFMLCEVAGINDLKEDSTAYVSAGVKKHVFRLPVEVPYVPKRRRLGYIVYAVLSGIYSYTVLYIVARFAGNFVRNFSPEWGFIPEIGVALIIFRSRIRLLVNFMKFFYLDKKDRILAWFTPRNSLAAATATVVFLALPIWPDSVSGKFVLEPAQRAMVHARVPGVLVQLDVKEGQHVAAGQSLGTLSNLPLSSDLDDAHSRLALASERLNSAALRFRAPEYGAALQERNQWSSRAQQLSQMNDALQLVSPISGTVVTPKVRDLLGSYLTSGQQCLEVADLSTLLARIYVPEYDMHKIHGGAAVRLQVQGFFRQWGGHTFAIAAQPMEMDPALTGGAGLSGLKHPHYYVANLLVPNPDLNLRPGMTGLARIYGGRKSLAGMGWEAISNFWARKLW